MYESYYHFKEKPFEVVPNPAYLYLSRTHKQAMTYMRYGMQERLGFVLMTGGIGSGKTTLIRELIRTMNPEITLARVFNTKVTSEELIAMINEDFGLETMGKGKVQLMKDLYAHLIREYTEGRRSVLIIDEAQNLSLDLLEEVRMLSNLETDDAKLLQILLVGQPELDSVLSLDKMRQFRQRISIACRIENLTRKEVEEYILHRLTVAGNREALAFPEEAFDAIYEVTGGIPRQINTLCSFLLLTAFTEERRDTSAEMVREVAAGLGFMRYVRADDHDHHRHGADQAAGDIGRLSRERALLRALGAMFHDEDDTSDSGVSAKEGGASNRYPEAVKSIGLRLLAMEKEIAHDEKTASPARKQRIETSDAEIVRAPAEQRPDQQGIAPIPPVRPYCDVPEHKGPR
jgi:putative secretion ATPase (PEP-CTERM system associated)